MWNLILTYLWTQALLYWLSINWRKWSKTLPLYFRWITKHTPGEYHFHNNIFFFGYQIFCLLFHNVLSSDEFGTSHYGTRKAREVQMTPWILPVPFWEIPNIFLTNHRFLASWPITASWLQPIMIKIAVWMINVVTGSCFQVSVLLSALRSHEAEQYLPPTHIRHQIFSTEIIFSFLLLHGFSCKILIWWFETNMRKITFVFLRMRARVTFDNIIHLITQIIDN